MQKAAAEQEFEQAAILRNRLKAVRSLLERQRIANEAVGTLDAIGVAAEETDANAQVFQVRDGVLQGRQSFYLENAAQRDEGEVAEEFVLQYYASALAVPPQVIVPPVTTTDTLAQALAERRGAPLRCATPSAATSGILDLRAQREAGPRPGPVALRAQEITAHEALEGCSAAGHGGEPMRWSASTSPT